MKKNEKNFFNYFPILIITFICKITIAKCILEIPIEFINVENDQNTTNESNIIDNNRLLVAKVKVGTSSQELNLLLDTTSSITWVALEGSNDEFLINNHYDPKKSETSEKIDKQFEINITGYYCKGDFFRDSFEFLENQKFQLIFGVAKESKFDVKDIDGIIGLAYDFENDTFSFINSLKEAGIIDDLSFSILINENLTINEIKGIMYIGKHEDFLKKETVSCPLIFDKYKNYWVYNIESFGLNNSKTEIKSDKIFEAIFDTASNVIVLPIQYFIDIRNDLQSYGCQYVIYGDLSDTTYRIACMKEENLPNFKLKLSGSTFILPKDYMFYKIEEIYYSRIIFNGQNCIIGTPFFSLYHTMFDKKEKMLRFYSKMIESEEKKEKKENSEPQPDESGFKTIYLLYILLPAGIIIIVIIVLVVIFLKKKKNKENINAEEVKDGGLLGEEYT